MKARIEDLVGPVARTMWISTFHSMCARILRREAQRLGYKSSLLDPRRGRPPPPHQALPERARARHQAVRPRGDRARDQRRQEPAARRGRLQRGGGRLLRPDGRRRLRPLREDAAADERHGLRRPAHEDGASCSSASRRAWSTTSAPSATSSSTSTRTRTTPSTGSRTCWPAAHPTSPSWATTTRASTRGAAPTSATSSSSSATTPTRDGHPPRAELPQHAAHPRRRQRGREAQPPAQGQEPVDGARRGRDRASWSRSTTSAPRRSSSPARCSSCSPARPARGAPSTPADIAVLYRTNAQSRVLEEQFGRYAIAYQVIGGPKFYERAEIKDALAYLSVIVNPDDEQRLLRIVNVAEARPRPDERRPLQAQAAATGESAVADAGRGRRGTGPHAGRRQGLSRVREADRAAAAPAWRAGRSPTIVRAVLEESGYERSLRAQTHARGRGPPREPRGVRRRGRRVRPPCRRADR